MSLQLKVVLFLAIVAVVAGRCKYAKFSSQHSYCLPPNRNCELLDTGVSHADKETLVRLHNQYREKIATGREGRGGGMPSAANMMEMVWDNELAAVAQKHAEQCTFRHDCHECRQVDRFSVGQNIAMTGDSSMPSETDWEKVMKGFYDEVSMFNKGWIKPYLFGSWGHFTQVVWATSWRVGCGKAVFNDGQWYRTLIVCNYGPAGNMMGGEMYQVGRPCSACPSGSSCGSSYKGLCKANNPNSFSI